LPIEQQFDIVRSVEPALELTNDPVDVLTALGERVAPISFTRERTLPVSEDLSEFFPEGGLVRGRSVRCTGPSATSLALSLVAPAVAEGAWMALIDLPTIGLDAAGEYGIPLERIVRIDTVVDGEAHRWSDVVAAAADGFDVLLVRVPADVAPTVMRKVTTRVQQRGAVIVVLGDPGSLVCDAELSVEAAVWDGVIDGAGHLRQRMVTIRSGGRRMHGRCHRDLLLPAMSRG
jgi:hypothetical protein